MLESVSPYKIAAFIKSLTPLEKCVFTHYYILKREAHERITQAEVGRICWPARDVTNARVAQVVRDIKIKFNKFVLEVEPPPKPVEPLSSRIAQ